MLKVTIDTNVLVSALLDSHGKAFTIISYARQHKFDLVVSHKIIEELERVLGYKKLQALFKKRGVEQNYIDNFIRLLRKLAVYVSENSEIRVVHDDPADDMIIACALESKSDLIVSGDKHLLNLKKHQGVQIINPSDFLRFLSDNKNI